jgi:hypothetical protein
MNLIWVGKRKIGILKTCVNQSQSFFVIWGKNWVGGYELLLCSFRYSREPFILVLKFLKFGSHPFKNNNWNLVLNQILHIPQLQLWVFTSSIFVTCYNYIFPMNIVVFSFNKSPQEFEDLCVWFTKVGMKMWHCFCCYVLLCFLSKFGVVIRSFDFVIWQNHIVLSSMSMHFIHILHFTLDVNMNFFFNVFSILIWQAWPFHIVAFFHCFNV